MPSAPTPNLPFLAAAHDVLPINEERDRIYGILTIDVDRFRPRLVSVTLFLLDFWVLQHHPFNCLPHVLAILWPHTYFGKHTRPGIRVGRRMRGRLLALRRVGNHARIGWERAAATKRSAQQP
jgi:hypothetical protein